LPTSQAVLYTTLPPILLTLLTPLTLLLHLYIPSCPASRTRPFTALAHLLLPLLLLVLSAVPAALWTACETAHPNSNSSPNSNANASLLHFCPQRKLARGTDELRSGVQQARLGVAWALVGACAGAAALVVAGAVAGWGQRRKRVSLEEEMVMRKGWAGGPYSGSRDGDGNGGGDGDGDGEGGERGERGR
jgi:hypothetical protein